MITIYVIMTFSSDFHKVFSVSAIALFLQLGYDGVYYGYL